MKEFYITFGYGHVHEINNKIFEPNTVGIIKAPDMNEARNIAFKTFGPKFFTVYEKEKFESYNIMQLFPNGFLDVN